MGTRIQLRHPSGKKAISIDKMKYDTLKNILLGHLKSHGLSTHSEILRAITDSFRTNKVIFEGSIEWYMEWVKLDLESRKVIMRIAGKPPLRFKLA